MKRHLPVVVLALAILALGGAAYAALRLTKTDRSGASFATAVVKRGDLRQDISFTGTVVPATDADLSFERGGTIAAVGVKAGDRVVKGQTLASLSAADLVAQVEQARAGVAAAQAKLDAMERGARPEAVAVQDAQVAAARTSLDEATSALIDRVTDAYAKADDAVRGKVDAFFVNPLSTSPHLSFDPLDSRLASDLGSRRFLMESELHAWQIRVASLTTASDGASAIIEAKAHLDDVSAFLADCARALDRATTANSLSQTSLDAYKTSVSLARTNMTAATSALSSGQERVRSAQAALTLAESQRTLGAAAATGQDIAIQEAVIRQAQAVVDTALAQLGKTVLRSPVSGTVAHVNISVGEAASSAAVAISVLSGDRYEIDTLASETQIAAFAIGDSATVTLDAYGNDVPFKATVARIDPAPATKAGQTGYPVVIRFDEDDARVKVGMTANARIEGISRTNVLTVPRSTLLTDDAGASVLLRKNGSFIRTSVKVGMSTQATIEITEGLSEGDVVANLSSIR